MCGHNPASNYNAGIMIPSDAGMFVEATASQTLKIKSIYWHLEELKVYIWFNTRAAKETSQLFNSNSSSVVFFYCLSINLLSCWYCHSTFIELCVTSFAKRKGSATLPPLLRAPQAIVSNRFQNHHITPISFCCISSCMVSPPLLVRNSRHRSASHLVSGTWDGE